MAADRALGAERSTTRGDEAARLRTLLRVGSLCLIPRRLDARIAAALDALSPDALPRLRFSGAPDALRPVLNAAVVRAGAGPHWLAKWLVEDVIDKAEVLAAFTGASSLDVRLDAIDDDCCRRFHIDNVRHRLVTTYRGPGTEWITPRVAAHLVPGTDPPPEAIRRLERGSVAILRGAKAATAELQAVLHRSPPIAGTGVVRLFLAIDESGRVVH